MLKGFIKLTDLHFPCCPIHIKVDHLVSFQQHSPETKNTHVKTIGGGCTVKETPEEITKLIEAAK